MPVRRIPNKSYTCMKDDAISTDEAASPFHSSNPYASAEDEKEKGGIPKLERQPSIRDEDSNTMRISVLKGGFALEKNDFSLWKSPKWKLLVFFSSTFTDTHTERNLIMKEIFPQLQEEGKKHGIDATILDMRWGVRDENTVDHQTWIACSREIERCRDESDGIFFVSLQAEKYGYTPLPRFVEKAVLEARLAQLEHRNISEDSQCIELAKQWYILDKNSVPPIYVLRNLSDVTDSSYWNVALPKLSEALQGLCFQSHLNLEIGQSVTDYEVKSAVLGEKDCSRIVWLRRVFDGGVIIDRGYAYWDFNDVMDDEPKRRRFDAMIDWMLEHIPPDRITSYTAASFANFVASDNVWNSQIYQWKTDTYSLLNQSLQTVIEKRQSWVKDGCGLGIPGDELAEMLHHSAWARDKVVDFVGRGRLIETVVNAVFGAPPTCDDNNFIENDLSGVRMYVAGGSGCGKTALMAKVAATIVERQQQDAHLMNRPVIVRFCGTSAGSTTGLALVRSICHHIDFSLNLKLEGSEDTSSMDYDTAVKHLHSLLNKYAVVLIIDSLDQLTDDNLARSDLSFLRNIRPNPNTRVIVSVLLDELEQNTEGSGSPVKWKYWYGCETKLKERKIERVEVGTMKNSDNSGGVNESDDEDGLVLLNCLLNQRGRLLTEEQWALVHQSIAVEPTALYMRLALRVVEKWSSFTRSHELHLAAGVRNLINQIFDTVERDFGKELTQAALGFITFSMEGVTDSELCDLLTLHQGVFESVNQYNKANRVPTHVWLRLRGEIYGLVTERDGGCLGWYHRQLREAAEARYSISLPSVLTGAATATAIPYGKEGGGNDNYIYLHKLMANYFGDLINPETCEKQGIVKQGLLLNAEAAPSVWLSSARVNKRRCTEAAYHMIQCRLLGNAKSELCSLESVCARAKSNQSFQLLNDITNLHKLMYEISPVKSPTDIEIADGDGDALEMGADENPAGGGGADVAVSEVRNERKTVEGDEDFRVDHYFRWIRADVYTISQSPQWNVVSSCSMQPAVSQARKDLLKLMKDECFQPVLPFDDASSAPVYLRGAVVGTSVNFDGLLIKLQGHQDDITSVQFSPDDSRIASSSKDSTVRIWDTEAGSLLSTLQCRCEGFNIVRFSPDGTKLATGSTDGILRFWDVKTGAILHAQQEEGRQAVTALDYSMDGKFVVFGSNDGRLKVWNVQREALQITFYRRHNGAVNSVSVSPCRPRVASGGVDWTVCLWNLETGSLLKTLRGHWGPVMCVAFNNNGRRVVSGGGKVARVWNVTSVLRILKSYSFVHPSAVTSISLCSDGKFVATGCKDMTVRIWTLNGELVNSMQGDNKRITAVNFSHNGSKIVSGSIDRTVRIWDATAVLPIEGPQDYRSRVSSLDCNRQRKQVACGSDDRAIRIWDLESGRLVDMPVLTLRGHNNSVTCVRFCHDGTKLSSGSEDCTVRLWNIENGCILKVFRLDSEVISVSFNYDDTQIITTCKNGGIQLLFAEFSGCLPPFFDFGSHMQPLMVGKSQFAVFSPDRGIIVAACLDKKIRVWDVTLGAVTSILGLQDNDSIEFISFNFSGDKFISLLVNCQAIIWGRQQDGGWAELHSLKHEEKVTAACFSPDGRSVVTGSGKHIWVWNAASGVLNFKLQGHSDRITAVSVSCDGAIIVSASSDQTVRVWDAVRVRAAASPLCAV